MFPSDDTLGQAKLIFSEKAQEKGCHGGQEQDIQWKFWEGIGRNFLKMCSPHLPKFEQNRHIHWSKYIEC